MKRYLLLVVFFLFFKMICSSNNSYFPTKKILIDNQKYSLLLKEDTLHVLLDQQNESTANFDWQKNMPWIGAVLIGILTVIASLIISRRTRITNNENTSQQLNITKEIALKQMENQNKNFQLDFNKTVLSGNRQSWINELRHLISKILSITLIISVRQNMSHEEYEELRYLITKAELMLNDTKDQKIISALKDLESCCLDIQMKIKDVSDLIKYDEKVKSLIKITLKTEWERVKKGE